MTKSNKNNEIRSFKKTILFVLIFFGFIYFLYISLVPVKIISFVREGSRIYLFVENFPITDKARIAWWLDNKELLKEKYNLPFIGSKYPWTVLVSEVGDGFQFLQHRASDNDLRCFDSLKPGANCVEKKWLLWISHFNQVDTRYTTDDSEYIQRGENAEIKRVAD
ncbi:DUF943 family protein [Erwinia rhapontici]|uniref:DUF943 family protein n=1 Tax=Erwinia TaxID=551 RepID=UPI0013312101|nr:DUF943 family protein [Erwinia rhapontici]MBP2155338.1 hypothetical protein [Erwinia rhapontici]NKG32046.1 DUF943 family protein [Erwinia rhapontici]